MSDPVSHAQFAQWAARIAQCAATWAADSCTFKDQMQDPMKPESVERFAKQIEQWLEACRGR